MLNILLIIILLIIITLFIILNIGIKITLSYTKKDKLNGCLKITILKKIKIYTLKIPSKSENKKETPKPDLKKIIKEIKPCLNYFLDYLKIILKTIKIKKIQNHIILGLNNFADTGKYIGILWGIFSIINSFNENIKLSGEPTFTKNTSEAYGENEIEINLFKLIIPTIQLLSKKEVREFIKNIRG